MTTKNNRILVLVVFSLCLTTVALGRNGQRHRRYLVDFRRPGLSPIVVGTDCRELGYRDTRVSGGGYQDNRASGGAGILNIEQGPPRDGLRQMPIIEV